MPADVSRMVRHIRIQADACEALGSPLYTVLLRELATDVEAGGPGAVVLAGHEADAGPSALALRLMGGVHRLVLDGRAPALAAFFPSVGGGAAPAAAWPALREVLDEHRGELRELLHRPPQTNEVGRAAALAGALAHVVAWRPAPVRLVELGASGGLNLHVDRFRIEAVDGGGVGPRDSPLVMRDAWRGLRPPVGPGPEIIERLGCDPDPVDPTTAEGRLTLTSYVWPDQHERLARLRAAFEIAQRTPMMVVAQGAGTFVRRLQLLSGTTTVVWHSVMWQYLDVAERAAVDEALDRLGAQAEATTGLARVSLEPARRRPGAPHEFLLGLRTWPGEAATRILGTAAPHGPPVTWE